MSASQIKLSLDNPGVFHLPSVNGEAAAKASEVLQENHDSHHIFFNQSGFHSMFPPGVSLNDEHTVACICSNDID